MRGRVAERCRGVAPATLLPPLAAVLAVVVLFGLGRGPVERAGASDPETAADPTAAAAAVQEQQTDPAHALAERARCERLTTSLKRYGEVKTFGDRGLSIGVIGDSYTAGEGLQDRSARWVARLAEMLPAQVEASGVGFTGFVSPGPCGGQRYATRTDRVQDASIVLLEGGLNDLWASQERVLAGVDDLVRRFDGNRVIVIGPVDVPARTGEQEVDAALEQGALAAGAEYVSMLPLETSYLPEGVHLTETGHYEFARRVAVYLRRGMR